METHFSPEEQKSKAKLPVENCGEEVAIRVYSWSFSRNLRKFFSLIILLKQFKQLVCLQRLVASSADTKECTFKQPLGISSQNLLLSMGLYEREQGRFLPNLFQLSDHNFSCSLKHNFKRIYEKQIQQIFKGHRLRIWGAACRAQSSKFRHQHHYYIEKVLGSFSVFFFFLGGGIFVSNFRGQITPGRKLQGPHLQGVLVKRNHVGDCEQSAMQHEVALSSQ